MTANSTSRPFMLGAVAYDPKVVTIWEGFADWFAAHDFAFDYVLYSNYEAQAEAHLAGDVDVTWDSPLAWVRTRRLAEAAGSRRRAPWRCATPTRTSPRSCSCAPTATSPTSPSSPARRWRPARPTRRRPRCSRSPTSPAPASTRGPSFAVQRFDVMVGKHGDHVGGERDAVKALLAGDADAACVIDGNHLAFAKEGLIDAGVGARADPHRALRPLHDDRARRRRRRHRRAVRRAAAVDVVRRSRPCGRCSSSRACSRGGPAAPAATGRSRRAVDRLGFYGPDGSIPTEGLLR